MGKRNKREAEKRRRHKQERQRRSRRAKKERWKSKLSLVRDMIPAISEEDAIFWRCHGVNYLMSNLQDGLWDPPFEDIYDGHLPSPEAIPSRLAARDDVSPIVMAWALAEKRVLGIYKSYIETRLRESGVEDPEKVARKPHQAVVWSWLENIRDQLENVE